MARVGRMTGRREQGHRPGGSRRRDDWDDWDDWDDSRDRDRDYDRGYDYTASDARELLPPDLPRGFGAPAAARSARNGGAGRAMAGKAGGSGKRQGIRALSTRMVVVLALLGVILGF